MRRCRPWFSAALRALHLLSSPLSHLHALFNLQVRNGGKLSFSVVVVAVIVELVPVLAAGALEGGYFADVFDLSAFGGGVSGEGLAVLEGEVQHQELWFWPWGFTIKFGLLFWDQQFAILVERYIFAVLLQLFELALQLLSFALFCFSPNLFFLLFRQFLFIPLLSLYSNHLYILIDLIAFQFPHRFLLILNLPLHSLLKIRTILDIPHLLLLGNPTRLPSYSLRIHPIPIFINQHLLSLSCCATLILLMTDSCILCCLLG